MTKLEQLARWTSDAIERDQQLNADEIVPTCDDYNRAFAVIELAHALMPQLVDAVEALRQIVRVRDHCAEHGGDFPADCGDTSDVCFDDWAANIASTVLEKLK